MGNRVLLEHIDQFAKLANADPVPRFRQRFERRIGLVSNRRHRHGDALPARGFQHQKREAPVAGDQRVFHLMTPRSDPAMNASTSSTSGVTASARICSIACDVFSLAWITNRNARSNAAIDSGAKPRRSKPILFPPTTLVAHPD